MILFVLPAETVYDKQDRVMGWKATPPSRDSIRALKAIVPRLRELNVTRIVSSDLDLDSAKLLARRLNVPYEEWQSLRRLNVGRWHGTNTSKFSELHNSMQSIWNEKPDVPIKGGDSHTSYHKRIAATREKLSKVNGTVIVVAGEREVSHITGQFATLQHNRVYAWEAPRGEQTQAV
jgi:broad specificity phosphatase PhoE